MLIGFLCLATGSNGRVSPQRAKGQPDHEKSYLEPHPSLNSQRISALSYLIAVGS